MNRQWYYSQKYVLFEICKQLKHRYLSVRKKKKDGKWELARYYQGYSVELLKESLERNDVLNNVSAKIYFDLATWKDDNGITPIFSYDVEKRKEQKEEFSKNGGYIKLIRSYDFAIDIDNKNIKKAWKEAKVIKEIFDSYKLPYSVKFSGSKGFHFLIDSKWIKTRHKPINLPGFFGKIVNNLVDDERLKSVDLSIYDARRIFKLAYSLCNNNGKEYVCLPLDDEQFENFKIEDMKLDNVIKKVKIFKRGLLERNHGLSEKQLKLNTLKFLKDYR